MTIDQTVVAAFTPTGKVRASINLGNPILANKNAETGEPFGVSVDLARAFADKLGVELELVVFDAAGKSVQAISEERADFGFFINPTQTVGFGDRIFGLPKSTTSFNVASTAQATNWLGRPGAQIAELLVPALGIGAALR